MTFVQKEIVGIQDQVFLDKLPSYRERAKNGEFNLEAIRGIRRMLCDLGLDPMEEGFG